MKGVILAGGTGSRLSPITKVINKHLVPILNRPMILYPISTLQSFGIKDVLVISGGNDLGAIANFLDNSGINLDINFTYKVQKNPDGIAGALRLANDFIGSDVDFMAILGDNIYAPMNLTIPIEPTQILLFLKLVSDCSRFGVPVFDTKGGIKYIEEKPSKPKSSYAVTGLYHYPSYIFDYLSKLKKSDRDEYEITDLHNMYIKRKVCNYVVLNGFWSDAGTIGSLARTCAWASSLLT